MRLPIALLGGTAVLAVALAPSTGQASSHREAPFIARMPQVDGTDFYMFMSYETNPVGGALTQPGYVTILANYLPLQDAYGGPNYFALDPDALYEIHIDNDGDGVEDITFQFDFDSSLLQDVGFGLDIGDPGQTKNIKIPFTVFGAVQDHDTESTRNQVDTFTVNMIRGPRRTGTAMAVTNQADGATTFKKPLDNIGPKSIRGNATDGYAAYGDTFIYTVNIPGCTPPASTLGPRVFVGQRQEGFPVNLGEVFDLINLAPKNVGAGAAVVVGPQDQSKNIVGTANVTTLALEIPASCLTAGSNTKIGGWTTASVRQARVINPTPTFKEPSRVGGPWVQVSRLGMPLVNEVVIGLKDKNLFNSSEPKDDVANFADYVTNPSLPELVEILFGSIGVVAPNDFPRLDLLTAFATGITGVNDVGGATATPSEMVRLNTAFPPTLRGAQNSMGAIGCFDDPTTSAGAALNPPGHVDCDVAGFPNGRRPGDDVVDIELKVAMGGLLARGKAPKGGCLHILPSATDTGCVPYSDGATFGTVTAVGLNGRPNMAANFQNKFPYLNDPIAGAP